MPRVISGLSVVAAAVVLTIVFWKPLWTGGGLIGGDTYPYFFPQKTFYADSLARGELPLWNPLVSLGYPQHAESQTGALYPPNLVLYRLLDVNTAYNVSHILHYVAAYVFSWLLARRLGLNAIGAHLAAIVFVYGWFPPRACLEWAIIGGVYFPMILWFCESYLQTSQRLWLILASAGMGTFLLAGHFNLAFLTLLTAAVYIPARLFWARSPLEEHVVQRRGWVLGGFAAAVLLGFGLAAVQLIPTVELKQNSQRDDSYLNQTYGSIPPWYLTQILWPRLWYGPDTNPDAALWSITWGSPPVPPGNTNKIEAHLYFGAVPFYLLLIGALVGAANGRWPGRRTGLWIILGVAAIVFATGWPIYWLRNTPGFGFFAGPGRYGIITTMAVALGAGAIFDRLLDRIRLMPFKVALAIVVPGLTIVDLYNVSRWVTNVTMIPQAPVQYRKLSSLAGLLSLQDELPRVYAPGPNLPTITGLNCVPEYLGIGPKAYFDPQLAFPRNVPEGSEGVRQQSEWLQKAGVTHLLTFEPLDLSAWPAELVVELLDPVLNGAWGRGREPLYLYRLRDHRARAFFEGQTDGEAVHISRVGPHTCEIDVEDDRGGRLILLDLAYPGWTVSIDDQPAEATTFEDMFRAVDIPAGKHKVVWTYKPVCVRWGWWVTAATIGLILAWAIGSRRSAARRIDS